MNFKSYLMLGEASYKGNIGMMETFKFYQVASKKQKEELQAMLAAGKQNDAWDFIQTVTNTKLQNT